MSFQDRVYIESIRFQVRENSVCVVSSFRSNQINTISSWFGSTISDVILGQVLSHSVQIIRIGLVLLGLATTFITIGSPI